MRSAPKGTTRWTDFFVVACYPNEIARMCAEEKTAGASVSSNEAAISQSRVMFASYVQVQPGSRASPLSHSVTMSFASTHSTSLTRISSSLERFATVPSAPQSTS